MTRAIFILTNLVSIGLGIWWFRASVGRPIRERLALAALPFLGCTVAWHALVSVAFTSMAGFWNGARLAPAMGLTHGYRLYSPVDKGVVNGWIYGPVAALAYLAAVLVGNSGVQILAARVLSLIYYYGPAAWLIFGADRLGRTQAQNRSQDNEGQGEMAPGQQASGRGRQLGLVLLFLCFVVLTSNSTALRYSSTEVHADSPALALAALSVIVLVRGGGGQNPWTCTIALILGVLAVWAKQLTIPILALVLPGYAIATGALKNPLRSVMPGLVIGLVLSLVMLAAFEPSNLILNVVQIPSHHPLRAKVWIDFLYPLLLIQQKHAPLWILLAVGVLARIVAAESSRVSSPSELEAGSEAVNPRAGVWRGEWPLFLLAGLLQLPVSILGYYGVGGNDNSLSFSLYFVTLGTLLMLKPFFQAEPDGGQAQQGVLLSEGETGHWVWYLVIGLNLSLATTEQENLGLVLAQGHGNAWQDSIVAERYIRAHPGEVYFPWNPQSHLAGEGKYYHAEDGLYDRAISGFPLTLEHVKQHIPPRTRLICYPMGAAGFSPVGILNYLKDFKPTTVPELPGWGCFTNQPVE